ncbi:programmed cell death protein 7 [Anomaloglossus baeobatrachus]|uniref:programmed cell death protein 7 n=1 Tax=Anomaloglossus baeobatrachus TaxID=238106 RepID=UPI003F507853
MERRPPAPGPWDRPRYGGSPAPLPPRFPPLRSAQLGDPRVYYPDVGAPLPAPWEVRPPYEAGRPGTAPQEGPEQRATGGREGAALQGPHHGRPLGMPQPPVPAGRTPDVGPEPWIPPGPLHRAGEHYGQPAEPPHYSTLHHGAPLTPQVRRPPYSASATHEDPTRRETLTQPGQLHGGPHHRPDDPHRYSEGPPPRSQRPDFYQPNLFREGGPRGFGGPDPVLPQYSHSHHSGPQPAGFHHDVPHNGSNLQSEGSQAGVYHPNTPTVPNTVTFRAPSPGLPPAPTQNIPYNDSPQQGLYHLPPPIPGPPPNPSYAVPPPVGTAGFRESVEGNLEVPNVQGHVNLRHHFLNQQNPDPLMPAGMVGGRNFEQEAPFLLQHGMPVGHREPNLLLPHGAPFVSQPTPYIQDNLLCIDRQPCAIKKSEAEDKDVFMQWLSSFLSSRKKEPQAKTDADPGPSIAEARGLIYSALRLVSQLDSLCQALDSHDKAGMPWRQDYEKAVDVRVDLEMKLKELEMPGYIQGVKRKLDIVRKKRLRWQRRRQAAEEEDKAASERSAGKEASIDLWRMQCIQKVEERKRERELKATADSVLGEVRRKQNDVKKMLDALKALEKLRKLRKEAAGRKGVCPPLSADETFANHINRLRSMVHKRSALYDAEEKTLRVILEGEQEEERQRETDKRLKKEREKTLHKQRELDRILFGDTESLSSLHPLQPFRHYYLQAEHSMVSLVQIRNEWDRFLVPPDHPDGSSVPHGWVVPTAPYNDTWATALKQSD